MIRKINKGINIDDVLSRLEKLENDDKNKVIAANELRRKQFKDELDSAFYFSVVFNTRRERDEWLKQHNISLVEDFFVKAEKFLI